MTQITRLLILLVTLPIFLISCGADKKSELDIKYYPFQADLSGKWGYLDNNGAVAIDTIFENEPGFFNEGFAIITDSNGYKSYINEQGKIVSGKYAGASLFNEGMACVVKKNGAPEYINNKFETVFEMKDALAAGVFADGLAKFQAKNGKLGFMNKSGKIAIEPVYDYAASFNSGKAIVTKLIEGKEIISIIDKNGQEIFTFDKKLTNLNNYYENVTVYSDSLAWGIINDKGETVFESKDLNFISEFFNSYASFLKDEKWGLMDMSGKTIIEAKYSAPLSFSDGLSPVKKGDKFGFIDLNENEVIPAIFSGVAVPFSNGVAAVSKDKDYFLIDASNNLLADRSFAKISSNFYNIMNRDYILETQIFDVEKLARALLPNLSDAGILGFTKGLSVDDIIARYKIDKNKLFVEGNEINIPFSSFNKELGFSIVFQFDKKLKENGAGLETIEFSFAVTDYKHPDKAFRLLEELKKVIINSGFAEKENMNDFMEFVNKNSNIKLVKIQGEIKLLFSFNK